MIINITYDSSVTNLNTPGNPAFNPTLFAQYTGAVNAAVQFFDTTFTNPITVNINFGWGEVGGHAIDPGASGQSSSNQFSTTYSQLRDALAATDTTSAVQLAAVASLPATDPTGGTGVFSITTAEAAALGLQGPDPSVGGSVGLDSSASENWSWVQNAVPPSGSADAVGTLEHEISEVLGRGADGGKANAYSTLDLFRYTAVDGGATDAPGTAVGVRDEPFMAGYNPNAFSYFSYNGTTVTLPYETPADVTSGSDVVDWAPSVPNDSFADSGNDGADIVSTTDLQEMQVLGYTLVCFLRGTYIATPTGEVTVESLAVGDRVLTFGGAVKAITWIGSGKVLAPGGSRSDAAPVIVRKGALGDGVPHRALRVTKGHSLYLDGVLIPVEFLVNHRSIRWDNQGREVEVYHIELESHDVLLANGAPAESYRDDGNRWLFRNANAGWDQPVKPPFAPVMTGGPIVDAVWRRLLDRSGPLPEIRLTEDPDLHLVVDGSRVDGRVRANGAHVFRLPVSPKSVRIVSRAGAPATLGVARDPRALGVAVRLIVLWRGQVPTVIDAADPLLGDGFHQYEPDSGWRWTDGNAALPASLLERLGERCELELHVAATARYELPEERHAPPAMGAAA